MAAKEPLRAALGSWVQVTLWDLPGQQISGLFRGWLTGTVPSQHLSHPDRTSADRRHIRGFRRVSGLVGSLRGSGIRENV
jgi:hypothetical protein